MTEQDRQPTPGSRSDAISAARDAVIGAVASLVAGAALTVDAFAGLAGVTGLYVIEAAQIALQRSRREDIRQFAQQMVVDHKDLAGKLGSFLGGMNRPNSPPEEVDRLHKVLLDDLRGVSDEAFDARYLAQQDSAHTAAARLFSSYKDHGGDEGLRNLAKLGLPVLEHHLEMIRKLEQSP
jgi:putative membrane protein